MRAPKNLGDDQVCFWTVFTTFKGNQSPGITE